MQSSPGKSRIFLIFFVAFSAFSFELILTRIFSILMWYHFASLSIGLAMLGLGGGGVLAYLAGDRVSENFLRRLFVWYLLTFLIVHGLFFYFHSNPDVIVPFLSFFHQPYFQPFQRGVFYGLNIKTMLVIGLSFAAITTPFLLAGAIIAGIFKLGKGEAQKLYYADMTGAAGASVFLAVVLNILSPLNLLSFLSLTGSLYVIYRYGLKLVYLILLLASVTLFAAGAFFQKDEILIARGKASRDISWVEWNAFSRVILYPLRGEEKVNPFGQSPYYHGVVPEQWGLLVDDTGYTVASEYPDTEGKKEFFRWNIVSLPYILRNDSALIIGPGGGKDIFCAISMGVKEKDITAVELNPLIVKAVNKVLGEKSLKLYDRVNTHVKEGRSFLEKDANSYGVIQATSVYGRIPPAAGVFTFAEDNLYTLEAFKTYLTHLKDNGALAVSRFIYEQTVPKLILLSKNNLKTLGLPSPEKSLFLAKERGLAMLLVKKGELTQPETQRLLEFCREKGFEVLYEPFGTYDNAYANLINDDTESAGYLLPTDDRPFYYYGLTKSRFAKAMVLGSDRFEERGVVILKIFFLLSLLFVFLIFVLPFLRKGVKAGIPDKICYGVYFFSIGMGYIMIEIILIKGFSLFLETPVYSMIFVVGSLLYSSALGSLFSRNRVNAQNVKYCFVVLILLIFSMSFVLLLINKMLFLPLPVKILIAVLVLSVLGFFMGIPFPFALSRVGVRDEGLVPWALAINSAASVLGSFFCLMAVINIGFSNSFYMTGGLYMLAFLMNRLLRKGNNAV